MSETAAIPPRLEEIIEEFRESDGQEKLELLLEFSERMPALPERMRNNHAHMDQVHECMTPVFIDAENGSDGMTFFFDIPAESPTVRGYAALLAEGVQGSTPEQVLRIPDDFYTQMGLQRVLTGQRLNGISAILAYMKRLALRSASTTPTA